MRLPLLSRKGYPEPDEIQLPDTWTVGYGTDESDPFIYRLREKTKALWGHPAYQSRLTIAVRLNETRESGFPTPAESERMYEMDDAFEAAIGERNEALLTALLFRGGFRELVFYTSDPRSSKEKYERVAARLVTHESRCEIEGDAEWAFMRAFQA
jgi:hypothetical protein